MMKLSILICSHVNRWPLLERIVKHLRWQATSEVEVIYEQNCIVMERGNARNILIDKARGEYCAFVDDDDCVSDSYVETILKALESGPDICSLKGIVTSLMNNERRDFELSIKHDQLFSLPNTEKEYKRFSSHLCPIKTTIARKVRFPDKMYHEDNGYSDRLKQIRGTLTEQQITEQLYYYFSRIMLG